MSKNPLEYHIIARNKFVCVKQNAQWNQEQKRFHLQKDLVDNFVLN